MNVGRNDPCPCGSGKKFKKCCIDTFEKAHEEEPTGRSRFSDYLRKHETGHVLELITSLQLVPENYGKNFRIELMANEAVTNICEHGAGELNKLRQIIQSEFPSHYAEDLPEELFTENVLFHGGNFTAMPGINSNSADVFKYLTEAIYISRNNLSDECKREIYQGVSLVLNLGKILFDQARLNRYSFVKSSQEELVFPEVVPRLSFSFDELAAICKENNIDVQVIENFITQANAPEWKYYRSDPSLSPLVYKPFVRMQERVFMVLPSCGLAAINEYIVTVTNKHGVRQEIHKLCHESIWQQTWGACDQMDWVLTDIPLPAPSATLSVKERIFQFDAYMLAYVCYAFSTELTGVYEMYNEQRGASLEGESLDERTKAVITELKSRKELEGYQFLTIILFNSMGGPLAMALDKPQENELKTWFNVFDFINLAYAGEWGRLDLWKYAKVYEATTDEARIMATSQIDAYATYKRNGESFYLSDKTRFNLLSIVPGDGADLTRDAKINSDIHGALTIDDGVPAYQVVRRFRDYAPIYKPTRQGQPYELMLDSYGFVIWVQNFQVRNNSQAIMVEQVADTICFWFHRLQPALQQVLDSAIHGLVNFVLQFDESYFQPMSLKEVDSKDQKELTLLCTYANRDLTIKFPKGLRKFFIGGDNAGERTLLREILKGLNAIPKVTLSDQLIKEVLDQHMPLGPAKMMLLLDTRTDLLLDDRWLIPTLYISDAEVNLLLDKLVKIIDSPDTIPEKFQSTDDKKKFCNQIVLQLTKYLVKKLEHFNRDSLLDRLIGLNERLVHNREFSKVKTTAQIHCFGKDEKELEKILKKETKLVNTSLSNRCLIELVTLVQVSGNRKPSFDQLDELLAIMNEILNFGMLSDTIHFGMADPEIGLLKSGRIGTSKEFYDQKLQPFHKDNTIANIESQLESFSSQFETYVPRANSDEVETFYDKVDEAFLKDWGVDYTILNAICIRGAAIAESYGDSVMSMPEERLIEELKRAMVRSEDQVEMGLKKLTFTYDPSAVTDEKGYANADYFPWKYNREFSYARRPFVLVSGKHGKQYHWGMRQCIAASNYLQELFNSGRLTHGGVRINTLLGEIKKKNGKRFRNTVSDWLRDNTTLKVWEYEVSLKPNGHFNADKDYGDCDVFAYDPISNLVYNIECKRTEPARNIHQMKTEMDAYLGRSGQKKKVAKHEERDNWLQSHLDLVKVWVGSSEPPNVKSIIVTSHLIPTRYIRTGEIPLPIISYRELRNGGLTALQAL